MRWHQRERRMASLLIEDGLIVRPVGAMQRRDYGKRGNPLVSRLE